jgi:hypothetical protein
MRDINVSIQGMSLDFKKAGSVAHSLAGLFEREPTVVAWHDATRNKMSPVIAGADVQSRWRDYGQAYGGDINVNVNGDFDFIFADTSEFEGLGKSPYISVHDKQGHEYLCLAESLRDPSNPKEEACYRIDDTEANSALHEG